MARKPLCEFYWTCWADSERREKFYNLMEAMLLLHEDPKDPLDKRDRDAIESGNVSKILQLITESRNPKSKRPAGQTKRGKKAVIDFFARVRANALFMSKVHEFLDDLITHHGKGLTPGQQALVRLADAKLLTKALREENAGNEIGFPLRAWSC